MSRAHWGVCFKGPGAWGTARKRGGPGRQGLSPENLGLPPRSQLLQPRSSNPARRGSAAAGSGTDRRVRPRTCRAGGRSLR